MYVCVCVYIDDVGIVPFRHQVATVGKCLYI
jgi:hypothetical protein